MYPLGNEPTYKVDDIVEVRARWRGNTVVQCRVIEYHPGKRVVPMDHWPKKESGDWGWHWKPYYIVRPLQGYAHIASVLADDVLGYG